jgi:hypothetical protein
MSALTRLKGIIRKLTNRQLNVREFSSTLDDLALSLQKDVKGILTEAMIDLWADIVESTPVDLGVAEGNWQIDGQYNDLILHKDIIERKKNGEFHLYSGRQVGPPARPDSSNLKGSDKIVIFNNAPYIEELEHGSSPQSRANAMIADNSQKHKFIIEELLKSTGIFA